LFTALLNTVKACWLWRNFIWISSHDLIDAGAQRLQHIVDPRGRRASGDIARTQR